MITFERILSWREGMDKGLVTAAETKQFVRDVIPHVDEIMADMQKNMTVKELQKYVSFYRNDRKPVLVRRVFRNAMQSIAYYTNSWITLIAGEDEWAAMIKAVDELTDEKMEAKRAKQKAKTEELVKSITNPSTLEEYMRFLHYRGFDALTHDQLVEYDILYTLDQLKLQRMEKESAAEIKAMDGIEFDTFQVVSYNQIRHVARLKEHTDSKDDFNRIRDAAKKFGGYYYGWRPSRAKWMTKEQGGFYFEMEESRDTFVKSITEGGSAIDYWDGLEDSRQERAGERLTTAAEIRMDRADEIINSDAKVNTRRRAEHRQYALDTAEVLYWESDLLDEIGKALLARESRFLTRVRFAVQVEMLLRLANRAHRIAIDKGVSTGDDLSILDIDHVVYPLPVLALGQAEQMYRMCKGKRGYKSLSGYLKAAIDDAYKRGKGSVTLADSICDKAYQLAGDMDVYTKARFADYNRLQRMKVRSKPHMRAMLREFLGYLPQRVAKVSDVERMELDLVGMKIQDFFPTPRSIADEMVEWLNIQDGDVVLEPSAGKGDLADAVRRKADELGITVRIICVEPVLTLARMIEMKGYEIANCSIEDALENWELVFPDDTPRPNKVIANPPFSNKQDLRHIMGVVESWLESGDPFISVMSASWTFADDRASKTFRQWVENNGFVWEDLPEGSFKNSFNPTGVSTTLVKGIK